MCVFSFFRFKRLANVVVVSCYDARVYCSKMTEPGCMYGNADFCIRPRILNLERCRPGWVTYGKLKKEKYSSPDSIATDGEGELHSKKLGAKGLEGAIFFQ